MIKESEAPGRPAHEEQIHSDFVIVGGGLAGTCAAITAARAGLNVVLIQDRPVLGGNASSEVRLWVLGATSHMGNNNRWAREGGVIDEILVENLWRNPEGNPLIFDTIILEKVVEESRITLLLNTAVFDVAKESEAMISHVRAFCSQNSTFYTVHSRLFCDASGDGYVGFLSGAAFRMGAESCEEFGEGFAPAAEYGELLGHTLYFYSKDTGRPVRYVPPSFALDDITRIPRFKKFNAREHGCNLWWIEYGGRLNTVYDTENIKWELWKVVYGVWNHIKNSGKFPEAETLTLEWVGTIPGKRESRRFEGDYMLRQQDIIEQRSFSDAVSYGGWAIDLHPADGVFSEKPGCTQWHSRGIYEIPYRTIYSRNIRNLFLAGRITSSSHVAFGSTRVMATCAHSAQAVGMAAAICHRDSLLPAQLKEADKISELQRELLRRDQFIPRITLVDPEDLVGHAQVTASSQLLLDSIPPGGPLVELQHPIAQLLPVPVGRIPKCTFLADVTAPTKLTLELRAGNRPDSYTPDVILSTKTLDLSPGENQELTVDFEATTDEARYLFFCLLRNASVSLHTSGLRITGIVSVAHRHNAAVATSAVQTPPEAIGVETFEFWTPTRRPAGHNLAMKLDPGLRGFDPSNVQHGATRPTATANAWISDPADQKPVLKIHWTKPQRISRIEINFDPDYDNPAESVLLGHSERVSPFCVQHYRLLDEQDKVLAEVRDNHQGRNTIVLKDPTATSDLNIEILSMNGSAPAAIFRVRCYDS